MAQIFDPQSPPYQRTLVMGPPKTVKTPLTLAVSQVMGETIYIAADPGSEFLPSIPDTWAKDIRVVKPGPCTACNGVGCTECGGKPYDPMSEALNLAVYPWKKDFPNAQNLVWDSGSHTMEEILQYVADQEFFSSAKTGDKHVTVGEPGSPAHMNIPVRGDYLAMKGICERWTRLLFRQPLNLFVITHVDIDDKGGQAGVRGGPALVGKAMIQDFPRYFNAVLRTHKEMMPNPDGVARPVLFVYTEGDNFWIGGVRHKPGETTAKNPIPVVQVGEDLPAFWRLFNDKFMAPKAKETT